MTQYEIKSFWDAFLKIVGLLGGGLAGVFMLGIFTKRTNAFGAIMGALTSAGVVAWVSNYTEAHILLYGGCGLLTCVIVGYLTSLLRPAVPAGKSVPKSEVSPATAGK